MFRNLMCSLGFHSRAIMFPYDGQWTCRNCLRWCGHRRSTDQ
jgi:hypothetical protein